jgi:hypothetical protein
MLVDFESAVLDAYGNCLMQGVYVNYNLCACSSGDCTEVDIRTGNETGGHTRMHTPIRSQTGSAIGPAPFYTMVEKALDRIGGKRGAYLCLLMSPVNDLKLDFKLDMLDEDQEHTFVSHHLRLHLRQQANAMRASKGENMPTGDIKHEEDENGEIVSADVAVEETDQSALPTMLLCKIDNVVHVNLDVTPGQMFVNPNVPVSDWFRCANQLLADSNSEERLLPYEKQKCTTDIIYSAVSCSVDELERWQELSEYGNKMGHAQMKIWEVMTNYTIALLRRDADRRVVEITMFKDRILRGVLLGGIGVDKMIKVTKRLGIHLL